MQQARLLILLFSLLSALAGCASGNSEPRREAVSKPPPVAAKEPVRNAARLVHVVVALCDNKYQGIAPTPDSIANGDDPASNLYWGAGYGVKSFFRKAKDWSSVADVKNPRAAVLERAVYRHNETGVYLVADAYRGREIEQSIFDFLNFAAGNDVETIEVGGERLHVGGAADLVVYIGHDGLMDFSLTKYPQAADGRRREAIILSCLSKAFFERPLRRAGAEPLLWTKDLMAPEAYTLKAALDGWMRNEDGEQIRKRAAEAYQKYQRCGMKAALHTFATGW
ncbi:MAG TPA: hypothetical protein VJT74_02720 [Pyrinomonadaceae bacterium]|nr:hypothetical protein [Pyrinomonadaceae bacterium]